jgi:hypothetical protein
VSRSRRRPRRRSGEIAQRQKNSLQQLGFAVAALIMLLLVWNHLAEGAAGCFATMAGPAPATPQVHDAASHEPGPDAAPAPPLPGMIRLGQPPPIPSE